MFRVPYHQSNRMTPHTPNHAIDMNPRLGLLGRRGPFMSNHGSPAKLLPRGGRLYYFDHSVSDKACSYQLSHHSRKRTGVGESAKAQSTRPRTDGASQRAYSYMRRVRGRSLSSWSHGDGEAKQQGRRGAAAPPRRAGDAAAGAGAAAVAAAGPPRRGAAEGGEARGQQALARVRARRAAALPADRPRRPSAAAVASRLLAAVGLRLRGPRGRRRPRYARVFIPYVFRLLFLLYARTVPDD